MKPGPSQTLDDVLGYLVAGEMPLSFGPVRYTENGQELAVGDGLWGTANNFGPYRHDFTDENGASSVCFTTVTEGSKRSLLSIRVARSDGEAWDIEAIVVRPGLMGSVAAYSDGAEKLDHAGAPDARWLQPVPDAERMDRDELVRVADAYFSAVERNDGKGFYPFSDDCVRMEHGYRTSGESDARDAQLTHDPDTPYLPDLKAMGVKEQLETGFFRFVTAIRDRRFLVVDPSLGLVVASAFFDHAGTMRSYQLRDGTPMDAGLNQPFTWQVAEAFRVENGLITRIEAIMAPCPYGMKSGW